MDLQWPSIKNASKDVQLDVTFSSQYQDKIKDKVKEENVAIFSFAHDGMLPGKATIRLKLDEAWLAGKDRNNLFLIIIILQQTV